MVYTLKMVAVPSDLVATFFYQLKVIVVSVNKYALQTMTTNNECLVITAMDEHLKVH